MREADRDGPLLLPPHPTNGQLNADMAAKLGGHATSRRWLPPDQGWPELDTVRDEYLRVRDAVAADLRKLGAVAAKHRAEDERLMTALQEAHRTAGPAPKDERTPEERRVAERSGIEASLWAGVKVLIEVVDKIHAVLSEHMDEWLAAIRARASEAQAKRKQAERLLEEAQAVEWRSVRLGKWLKSQSGPFGAQPFPADEPMPAGVDPAALLKNATERPYFERPGSERSAA